MPMAPLTEPPIPLISADFIQVNISGGKDSQTVLRQVVIECDRLAIPRSRIVAVHATFREEWEGADIISRLHADTYGLEFHCVSRRRKDGSSDTLLDYVRRRKKWPDSQNRYCTSDFKRGPCNRVTTMLSRRVLGRHAKIINVFGFRSEESPARRKMADNWKDKRLSNGRRSVWAWLPIHGWPESEVWSDIKASGVPYHYAYDLGMPRLSCRFCVFAPPAALRIAAQHSPELYAEYVQIEAEIGHSFRHKFSITEVESFVPVGKLTGNWNM